MRPPIAADAPTLSRLADDLSAHENEPRGWFTPQKALEDVIAPDAPVSALLAEVDDAVAGFVMWHFAYETPWAARGAFVTDLFVEERARGAGVAEALMRGVARAAADQGGSFIWLTTYRKNARARAFYRKIAAEEDGLTAYAVAHERFKALLK